MRCGCSTLQALVMSIVTTIKDLLSIHPLYQETLKQYVQFGRGRCWKGRHVGRASCCGGVRRVKYTRLVHPSCVGNDLSVWEWAHVSQSDLNMTNVIGGCLGVYVNTPPIASRALVCRFDCYVMTCQQWRLCLNYTCEEGNCTHCLLTA